jgi:hypothetical protein
MGVQLALISIASQIEINRKWFFHLYWGILLIDYFDEAVCTLCEIVRFPRPMARLILFQARWIPRLPHADTSKSGRLRVYVP